LQFIDTLLERDIDYTSLATAIVHHIANRIRALCDVTPEDIREFEARASAETWDQSRNDVSYSSFLHYDATLAQRGIARAGELVADLNSYPDLGDDSRAQAPARLLRRLDVELLNTRHLVDLGTCSVDVRVRDGKCAVSLDGKMVLRDVATTVGDMEGPGIVDVCYNTDSATLDRLMIIATAGEIIAVSYYGPALGDQPLPHISMSRSDLRNQIRAYDELLDTVAREKSGPELRLIMEQAPRVIEALYLDPALNNVSDEHLDRTLSLLRAGGLRAVLDADYDLAEALAVAGAVCGAAPFRAVAEGELMNRNLNTQLLDTLLGLSAQGMPLISSDGTWLLPLV
jgi:hypothetical protein